MIGGVMVLTLSTLPRAAHAYIDLGLGGQLFQTVYLIAIGVTGFIIAPFLLFGRSIARRVRQMLQRHRIRSQATASGDRHPENR